MKYFELTKEEKRLLEDFEKGQFVRVKNLEAQESLFQKYAQNTLKKNRNINLRLSERDVQRLKAKAIQTGIPYQTLAASILHQFANKSEVNL